MLIITDGKQVLQINHPAHESALWQLAKSPPSSASHAPTVVAPAPRDWSAQAATIVQMVDPASFRFAAEVQKNPGGDRYTLAKAAGIKATELRTRTNGLARSCKVHAVPYPLSRATVNGDAVYNIIHPDVLDALVAAAKAARVI